MCRNDTAFVTSEVTPGAAIMCDLAVVTGDDANDRRLQLLRGDEYRKRVRGRVL